LGEIRSEIVRVDDYGAAPCEDVQSAFVGGEDEQVERILREIHIAHAEFGGEGKTAEVEGRRERGLGPEARAAGYFEVRQTIVACQPRVDVEQDPAAGLELVRQTGAVRPPSKTRFLTQKRIGSAILDRVIALQRVH